MKSERIIKALFAAAITIVAILCAIPAFAADVGDEVYIHVVSDTKYSYAMHGEIDLGTNTVTPDNTYSPCYEFAADKAGYYLISNLSNSSASMNPWFAESYDGTDAFGFADHLCNYNAKTELNQQLYYLEEGTHFLAIDINYEVLPSAEIIIEYFGDKIAEVSHNESVLLFELGSDVYPETQSKHVELYPTVTMTNGNVFSGESDYCELVECKFDSAVKEGKNPITIKLPGYDYKTTACVYTIENVIESIEFSHTEKYTKIYEYYNGLFGYYDPVGEGESVKVNYADGTSRTFFADGSGETVITVFEEVYHYVDFSYVSENEKTYFVAEIAGAEFIREECESIKADARSNYNYLKENISCMIAEFFLT